MRTAPWWMFSAGPFFSRAKLWFVVVLAAALVSACIPEHSDEHYAMSAVTKSHQKERIRAAKISRLPDRALLTPARAPECGSYTAAPRDTGIEQRAEDRASHQLASAESKEPENKEAKETASEPDRQTTASAATSGNPAATREQASSDLETRIALEYERACYKQAEARVRTRLHKLQQSVGETIKAVERRQE